MTLIGTVDGISFYWTAELYEGAVVRVCAYGYTFLATVERQKGRTVRVRDAHGKLCTVTNAQIEEVEHEQKPTTAD